MRRKGAVPLFLVRRGEKGVRPLFADQRGQTLTEYLMISGLMLTVVVAWIEVMFPTTQGILRKLAECVMSDICEGGSLFGF